VRAREGLAGHGRRAQGYRLPPEQVAAAADRARRWSAVPDGLQAGWGSTDGRYPRNEPPQADEAWSGVAWRDQRVSAQLLLWTRTGAAQVRLAPEPLRSPSGSVIPAAAISARFVRYVLADGKLVPDVLDTARRLDLGQERGGEYYASLLRRGRRGRDICAGDHARSPIAMKPLAVTRGGAC